MCLGMASKPRRFRPGCCYHIYNCGVEKRDIFLKDRDYRRFLDALSYYVFEQKISYAQFQNLVPPAKKLYSELNLRGLETLRVRLLAYCLMPNHFHLLLEPVDEGGVSRFIADLCNSHMRYFNTKYERIGGLFQGRYRAKEVATDEGVLQVSRYIHLNPLLSSKTNPDGLLKDPADYPFSSYRSWLDLRGVSWLYEVGIRRWTRMVGRSGGYKAFVEAMVTDDPRRDPGIFVLETGL